MPKKKTVRKKMPECPVVSVEVKEVKMTEKSPRNGRFVKGSQEAKDYMAKLRAMKKTKATK